MHIRMPKFYSVWKSSDMSKDVCFFNLHPETLTATCKLCINNKVLKYTKSSKSNLSAHIQACHSDAESRKSEVIGVEPIGTALLPYTKQEEVTDAVVDLIVDEYLPISWPEKQSVRKFHAKVTPRWKPVCKRTVRAKIIKKGEPFQFDFKTYKSRYGKPSATVDLWTSRARKGFMAVSLHLQTKHSSQTKVMDVAHIPTPHTAANVRAKFGQILGSYGMNEDDLFKVVSDNASTMKKAFSVTLWEADGDDSDENNAALPENEEIGDDEEVQDMEVEFGEVFQDGLRLPCSIHTLQLFVKDVIAAMPPRYRNVLGKCKVAAKKQHMSQRLTELATKVLPEQGTTRWNGQYTLMQCILDHFDDAMQHFNFTESDRAPLSALVIFLAPFFKSTKAWEAEKVATIHNVIPLLLVLERHIISSVHIPVEFKDAAVAALEKRFGFVTHDKFYLSATVLSSHGKKWLANAPNVALKFGTVEYILDSVKSYIGNLVDDLPLHLNTAHDVRQQTSAKDDSLDALFGYSTQANTSTSKWSALFDDHVLRSATLSAVLDPLAYWKGMELSPLSAVAIQILSVPASSAPVERIFSTCGLFCSSKRTRMKPDLLAALVRAKYNK